MTVQEICSASEIQIGCSVIIEGILVGTGFHNQYISDSVAAFDQGVALPIVRADLFERVIEGGVPPIGGGRFSLWYKCTVKATLSRSTRPGYKYEIINIKEIEIYVDGRKVSLVLS